jgi:hypothetical protein
MFNGKTHYKWPFSIAMLNYQRVDQIHLQHSVGFISARLPAGCCWLRDPGGMSGPHWSHWFPLDSQKQSSRFTKSHHEIGCIDDFLFQYPKYGEDHSDLCYVVPALQTGKSYPLEHSAFFQQW